MSVAASKIFVAQNGRCFYCNRYLNLKHYSKQFNLGWTKDHFIPKSLISKKKWKIRYNTVLAHKHCNEAKANRFPTKQEVTKLYNIYQKILNFKPLLLSKRVN